MMRKCHLNTCPVGVATQDPVLRKKFTGKPEHVVNYLFMVAEEARQIMAELGFRTIDEMIGRVDCLETNAAIQHWKADGLDLTPLLTPGRKAARPGARAVHDARRTTASTSRSTARQLLRLAEPALQRGEQVRVELPIDQHEPHRRHDPQPRDRPRMLGEQGLPDDTIHFKFTGSAGQSFGAFLAGGVTLELEGDANDYVGKGLSGGRLIIYPPKASTFRRRRQHHHRQRRPVRRDQRPGVLPRPGGRAVLRPQQRRPGRDRRRRRPRLRVHDRRPRRHPRARPAATSRPA